MTEYRAVLDAEVTFLNGGGLQVQGFRLDLPTADVTDDQLADLLIGHLGLLMVDRAPDRSLRGDSRAAQGFARRAGHRRPLG